MTLIEFMQRLLHQMKVVTGVVLAGLFLMWLFEIDALSEPQ